MGIAFDINQTFSLDEDPLSICPYGKDENAWKRVLWTRTTQVCGASLGCIYGNKLSRTTRAEETTHHLHHARCETGCRERAAVDS
ncbi:unnamed protein product [Arctogadus glacialis]